MKTGIPMFDSFETYPDDLLLLKELGLKPFKGETWEKIKVGTVRLDKSQVKIWVEGAPAQFWYFKIYCGENKKTTKISTGSGTLCNYWPFAKAIAEGMVTIGE